MLRQTGTPPSGSYVLVWFVAVASEVTGAAKASWVQRKRRTGPGRTRTHAAAAGGGPRTHLVQVNHEGLEALVLGRDDPLAVVVRRKVPASVVLADPERLVELVGLPVAQRGALRAGERATQRSRANEWANKPTSVQ